MKTFTLKMLTAFIIMVFSVSLADAQCSCYCTATPKFNSICVTNPNGNSHCKHVGPRYCGKFANEISTPDVTTLDDVYPNPLSSSTTVAFYVKQTENVSIKIFDLSGRFVTTLADASFEEGEHEITWSVGDAKAGIYILQFQSAENFQTEKLIVAK